MSSKKQKPEVTKSIIITAITKKAKETAKFLDPEDTYKNIIIPLTNFGFIEYEEYSDFYIKTFIKLPKKIDRIAISISTDPKLEHAGDWSDLGQFRLVFKILDPIVSYEDNKTILKFTKNKFQQDLWMPDRVKY